MTDDASPDRLPLLDVTALTEEQRAVYDAITASRVRRPGSGSSGIVDADGHLLGPFNAMLHSPAIGMPLQELGRAVRFRTGFSAREREIATLTVAARSRSDYEWYSHERIARDAGLTEEEISAVRADRPPPLADARERIVYDVARALAVEGDLGDVLYAEATATLGRPALVELITLVGYYAALALLLRVFRVRVPDGEPTVDWDER